MSLRIWILRLAVAIALLAAAVRAPAADFYAYYTKLDYTQPATPDWLGLIPVNAANMFSDGRPDPADAGHGGSARVDPLKALGSVDIPIGKFCPQRFWVVKKAASAVSPSGSLP